MPFEIVPFEIVPFEIAPWKFSSLDAGIKLYHRKVLNKRIVMASGKGKSDQSRPDRSIDRLVYSEFGDNAAAFERATPDLPPNQQNLRVQASRKGRGGKTVTVISGFQSNEEALTALLKKLKAQCGAGGTLKDSEIEIQGDHAQKLTQILVSLGYRAKVSGGSGKSA